MAFASISGFREGQGGLNEPIHDVLFGVHHAFGAKTGSVKIAHTMAAQIMSISLKAWRELGGVEKYPPRPPNCHFFAHIAFLVQNRKCHFCASCGVKARLGRRYLSLLVKGNVHVKFQIFRNFF